MTSDAPLPAIVIEALQRGDKIEAIKHLRAVTRLGLKKAKDVIDQFTDGNPVRSITTLPTDQLSASVTEALRQGNKIEAIKRLREQTGLGLKETQEAVEASAQTVGAHQWQAIIERPPSSKAIWWIPGLLLVGYGIYYLLRNL